MATKFEKAREYRRWRIGLIKNIRDAIFILIGVFSAAFGLEGFLLKNHFIDGGATGVSLLLSGITGWSLSIVIVLVNLPFIIMGNNHLGRIFAIKTCLAIMALALVLYFFDFPIVTNDKLLVAVFGGFFLGVGVGLSVRGGAVIDGTEVLAIYLSRKLGATIGDVVFIINVLIFSAAAYLLSIETALYSMITYLTVSKTLDFIVEGIEEYMGVTIISSHHEEIRMMIIHELGRGVTIYSGKGGYGKSGERKKELEILYTVITRLELNKINTEIEKIDPHAFVVMNTIKDTRGGMIKKRPLTKK
ncbi:MAG: YitT family protein [Chitinophagaceae bacterium]|nr:YitT family protein [Chitinophagaceae bacterium]MCA6471105.1 YitT family protein [Chitinophagaceae bacterium]MCA6477164.1 YitT family protein [Chitinophagaceae bacterium]MCA6480795.1 YitT family protein [Chitinophagaceae bacterium]MCA6485688.1 YitT family protein [Chitinophagaceae bacterium]